MSETLSMATHAAKLCFMRIVTIVLFFLFEFGTLMTQ